MRALPGGVILGMGVLLLGLGCGQEVDHCVEFSQACENWCEGNDLNDCLNEGAALSQAGDQNACLDATNRLACQDFRDSDDNSR